MSKKVFQAEGLETNAEPVVITTKTETAKPMAVEEAVMQMDRCTRTSWFSLMQPPTK